MTAKKSQTPPRHFSKLSFGLLMLVLGLLVGQIVLSNRLATKGKRLAQLDQEIDTLTVENKRLRTQQAEQVSLSELAQAAGKAGFVKQPPVVVLPQDQTVALGP